MAKAKADEATAKAGEATSSGTAAATAGHAPIVVAGIPLIPPSKARAVAEARSARAAACGDVCVEDDFVDEYEATKRLEEEEKMKKAEEEKRRLLTACLPPAGKHQRMSPEAGDVASVPPAATAASSSKPAQPKPAQPKHEPPAPPNKIGAGPPPSSCGHGCTCRGAAPSA